MFEEPAACIGLQSGARFQKALVRIQGVARSWPSAQKSFMGDPDDGMALGILIGDEESSGDQAIDERRFGRRARDLVPECRSCRDHLFAEAHSGERSQDGGQGLLDFR